MPFSIDAVRDSIQKRWGLPRPDRLVHWWRPPGKVRILMYADGSVSFDGGPFLGLQYVITLLGTRPYPYVEFDVATAHREGDPSATIPEAVKLTDLDIGDKYDEVWLFGFGSTPSLDADELKKLDEFMAAPKHGGVLVTGDHANLGRGIAGQIPRAGAMRLYPAPASVAPGWNTTLEEGPDSNTAFNFDDQSDDKPQSIRWERYPISSTSVLRQRSRPHPVLCGPDGPIDVLPDHQHEGEALGVVPTPGDPIWPTKDGHQEGAQVIAWGKIKDPAATNHGQEIGVISAYDGHNVDVGRIVADSTWHHWFDINLTGAAVAPSPYAGFDATPAGLAALRKIDAYFLNCGVWLAPPAAQRAMRLAGWWSILWTDRVVELSPDAPVLLLGQEAIDALGRKASRCTVSRWVFDWPIFKEKIPHWEWPQIEGRFEVFGLPFEQAIAGGILRNLMREIGPANPKLRFPREAPDDRDIEAAAQAGLEEGLDELSRMVANDVRSASELLEKRLRRATRR